MQIVICIDHLRATPGNGLQPAFWPDERHSCNCRIGEPLGNNGGWLKRVFAYTDMWNGLGVRTSSLVWLNPANILSSFGSEGEKAGFFHVCVH